MSGGWTVQIRVSTFLYIRTKPDKQSIATGRLNNGQVVTVTEIRTGAGSASGWGRLSDGSGWIALDWVEAV